MRIGIVGDIHDAWRRLRVLSGGVSSEVAALLQRAGAVGVSIASAPSPTRLPRRFDATSRRPEPDSDGASGGGSLSHDRHVITL
jgi:hypothetical protein